MTDRRGDYRPEVRPPYRSLVVESSVSGLLVFLMLLTFFVFQALFLTADSPDSLTDDIGIFVDEGFKTLDAKNLALYGKTHWCKYDEYPGWMRASPVTVVSNYLLFEAFGTSLHVARFGSLLYALGTMILLWFLLTSLYGRPFSAVALLILATNNIFFFYSRIALFEIKILFFIVCTLCLMKLAAARRLYGLLLPVTIAAAFYCKQTAAVFLVSLAIYYVLTVADGFLIKRLARPRNLFILLVSAAVSICLLEYCFPLFSDFTILERPFRSPLQAVLTLLNPVLFKKIPLLGSLALLYAGYLVARISDRRSHRKADLLFSAIFLVGLACHSAFVYRPLRYYFFLLMPVVVLATRALFTAPEIFSTLFNGKNRLFKGIVFLASCSCLTVFMSWTLVQRFPFYEDLSRVVAPHIVPIALGAMTVFTVSYFLLARHRETVADLVADRASVVGLLLGLFLLAFHLQPICRWAANPKYELKAAADAIDALGPDVIIVGQWAPQLCIDTKAKALYSDYLGVKRGGRKKYLNVRNLGAIKPDFVTFAQGVNEAYLEELKRFYPGVIAGTPTLNMPYGGRMVELYLFDFDS